MLMRSLNVLIHIFASKCARFRHHECGGSNPAEDIIWASWKNNVNRDTYMSCMK